MDLSEFWFSDEYIDLSKWQNRWLLYYGEKPSWWVRLLHFFGIKVQRKAEAYDMQSALGTPTIYAPDISEQPWPYQNRGSGVDFTKGYVPMNEPIETVGGENDSRATADA